MIWSSNPLASLLTIFVLGMWTEPVRACACVAWRAWRACVCDEWAGARQRSLGGLGSICLSVSCQRCQWLTTSSTHSTSLFITTRITHMRVRACPRTCAHTKAAPTRGILFHYIRRPQRNGVELEGREVREYHREKDGWVKHKPRTPRAFSAILSITQYLLSILYHWASFHTFSSCPFLVFSSPSNPSTTGPFRHVASSVSPHQRRLQMSGTLEVRFSDVILLICNYVLGFLRIP